MIKIFIYERPRKKDPVAALARAEYIKRLSRTAVVTFKKLPAVLPEDCLCFSSDGAEIDSPGLAQLISAKLRDGSVLHLVLGEGSSPGPKIQLTSLALSAETESVLLLEQIYRAFKILAHEPYHK